MSILSQFGSSFGIGLVLELHWTELLLQRLEDNEQRGHHEDLTERTNEHTAYGSSTQRLVTILTHTRGKHHRQQTDDHSQRSHEDRTQTGSSTQHGRPGDGHTEFAALQCELHNQNSILGQQSDKHDQRNLHIDVVGVAEELREEEGTSQTERHGEHHGQRQDVAFILCRQNQIDEDEAQQEDECRRVARGCFRTRQTRIVVGVASGQIVGSNLLHGLDGLTRGVAVGHRSGDGDGGEEVEAGNVGRSVDALQLAELLDGRHATGRAHIDAVERLGRHAGFGRALHHHTIELTIGIEVRSIESTIVTLQSGEDGRGRDATLLTLRHIDMNHVLRIVRVVGGHSHLDFRTLVELGQIVLHHSEELVERTTRTVLHDERHTAVG